MKNIIKKFAQILCGALIIISLVACSGDIYQPSEKPNHINTEQIEEEQMTETEEMENTQSEEIQQETEKDVTEENSSDVNENVEKDESKNENLNQTEQTDQKPQEEPKDEKPVVNFTTVDEIVYATSSVNVRKGPGTEYDKIGALSYSESIKRIGKGDNNWSKVIYNGQEAYVSSNYLSTTKPAVQVSPSKPSEQVNTSSYPLTYSDATCKITIYKEWYKNAWCYAAHLEFTDYGRLKTTSANGKYGSYETTSHAFNRLGAILCVNGDHVTGKDACGVVRSGSVVIDKENDSHGFYNSYTGRFHVTQTTDVANIRLSTLVANKQLTDTFTFVKPYLVDGQVINYYGNSRAQRTFIGTNEKPGDIWLVVSDGRYNDGKSAGLTYHECAEYLISKGCTQGTPLDGGGSSTMVFQGKVLNANRNNQRAVVDFVYFK
jgi:uncharacterized protein YraI